MALARVVSFAGVNSERMAEMNREMEGGERPDDVPATEIVVLHDPEAEKSVVILFFDNEEDYERGNAALNAMKPYLDAGETALGTRVDVRHLSATPAGRRVTGEAEVTKVDGRRIEFTIRATEGAEVIGEGTHERVIINLARFSEQLKAKLGR